MVIFHSYVSLPEGISKWQHLSVMLPIAILHVLANGDDKARRWLGGFKPQSSDNGEAGTSSKELRVLKTPSDLVRLHIILMYPMNMYKIVQVSKLRIIISMRTKDN